ncbi:MAG: HesA/MoeB/ThiF family protein [Trueperaceae bacterium]|nr:HesA/MoeB/ThiF family protein [Trueperaceae bacterium]
MSRATHASFGSERRERFARHLVLPELGPEGQAALAEARILVVGLGGLGAPVTAYLAGSGLAGLTLVDGGEVRRADLHRQILYREADLGAPKVDVAAARAREVDGALHVTPHATTFGPDTGRDLVRGHDVVIDATDNPATRYLVSDACVLEDVPLVFGSVSRLEGQVARLVRDRSEHGADWRRAPCYRCLHPTAPPPDSIPSCAEAGVAGPAAGVIGSWMALEALRLAAGTVPAAPEGLLHLDLGTWTTQRIRIGPQPGCAICGTSPTIDALHLDAQACLAGDGYPG